MMAEQKEVFEINGKKFQIIEVKEAEQQPDYSHLVGKFVRYSGTSDRLYTKGRCYPVAHVNGKQITIKTDNLAPFTWLLDNNIVQNCFDLSNPSDTNPDEKKKILVPSEVKIYDWSDGLMAIGFGNNQVLCVLKNQDSYSVGQAHSSYLTQ